ncbi:hypothetical protein R75461_07754 [Paraburkholderia nemoris]|uniref:hypothetical protein n=1 Tax=Paraburkholderia nemoris TaxID=2793076 RepID=UPI00190AEC1C|nr:MULTISPECIES: hypothetical protein [Paraburkholderia]MBK3786547.1 hypothetical protein [Paraburkholderia aspalathi]CAE6856779.1 hypothetical protein R75461_07754 [Paraburkholderia nemoris]
MNPHEEHERIAAHLQWLHDKHDNTLDAGIVVRDARRVRSPLHACFEWDDAVAGQQYRLEQARHLIRSVRIVIQTKQATYRAPAYVSDPRTRHGYVSTVQLRDSKDEARAALLAEFVLVRGLLERARGIARVLGLESEVEALLHGVVEVESHVPQALAA